MRNVIVRDINNIFDEKNEFYERYKKSFEGIGTFPGEVSIAIDEKVKPIAKPPRRIPNKVRDKLEPYLKDLIEKGIIEKVDKPTSWVSNVVIREKTDGSLQICLDPQELNKAITRSYYEIPSVNDLKAKLSGKKYYSLLDLKHGFWQIKIDKNLSDACIFSTLLGCLKFLVLLFGLSCSAEIFQEKNEVIFKGLKGVQTYIDDIIVSGDTEIEHDRNLENVMKRA